MIFSPWLVRLLTLTDIPQKGVDIRGALPDACSAPASCNAQVKADLPSDEVQLLQTTHRLNVRAQEAVEDVTSLECPAKMTIPDFEEDYAPSLTSVDEKIERDVEEKSTDDIINGKLTDKCKLPWMAFVYADKNTSLAKQDSCSAALITRQHLLTAAHCFYLGDAGKPFDWDSVVNGSFVNVGVVHDAAKQRWKTGQSHLIESVSLPFADSWYDGKDVGLSQGDIAVVKLRTPVAKSDCVSTICIPSKDYITKGAGWHVAGFGAANYSLWHGRFEVSESNPTAGMPLEALDMFAAVGKRWAHPKTDGARPVIEPGDSGGPFMVRDGNQIFAAGTVMGYAISLVPITVQVVYTNVYRYRKWIEKVVKDATKSPGGSAVSSSTRTKE